MYLNCDLGEGCGDDADLMPLIDQASVACGGHAGDAESMRATVALAARHGVMIGAHPSYPDPAGFGRQSMQMSQEALRATLLEQLRGLRDIAQAAGQSVRYCKPHGALYHDMLDCEPVAEVLADIAARQALALVVPAGSPDSAIAIAARRADVLLWTEAFADRGYGDDGRLLPRSEPGALLSAESAAAQVRALLEGWLVTASGRRIAMQADTLCVHGDTPQAIRIAQAVRQALAASA